MKDKVLYLKFFKALKLFYYWQLQQDTFACMVLLLYEPLSEVVHYILFRKVNLLFNIHCKGLNHIWLV